ncbi:MAG: DNA-binding protein [Candidatus Electrothrix sp. AR4]|nr:DNA-binding protein [Candidatus Electrothrix sp. AR4]
MDYRTGTVGRVLTIRFDHEEDFLEGLKEIVLKEKIRNGWFQLIGALDRAGVVTGPKEPVVPPDAIWEDIDEVREIVGSGSVYMDDNAGGTPKIHLHGAMGHDGETITACIRRNSRVYLLLEVVLFELCGIDAVRPWDEAVGINKVVFS